MMQWKIHTDTLSRGHGSPIVYACSDLVKYSNGGCSGFEPDFLFIYSAYNFSKPYLFNIIRLYCSPWRNARKGVFGGKMPVFAIPSVTLPCGARRNCKSLRSKTFGKYYIIPRGLLQVLARQITSRREKGQGDSPPAAHFSGKSRAAFLSHRVSIEKDPCKKTYRCPAEKIMSAETIFRPFLRTFQKVLLRLYSTSPLSFSRISISVPLTFFRSTLSISFSLKDSGASLIGFLSMA